LKLRKHQKKQNKLTLKALKVHDHVLYGAPTGFGKSICILDLIKRFISNGERVLIIAPYRKLVFQLLDTFEEYSPALLMGTDSYGDPATSPIVVASLSTLSRRLQKDPLVIGGLDKIMIDEAHISFNIVDGVPTTIISDLHKRYWGTSKWIGFTATPITASGYRLEGWDHSIYKYSTGWLIKKGWLAKFDYFSAPDINVKGLNVNKATGDYNTSDMEKRTNTASAINAVYKNYKKFAKGKKTLIFGASIEHAKLIHAKFIKKGISCRVIHSMIPEKEQKKILAEYKANVFDVLINVAMLTTGFDDPEVEVLFLARPVGSIRLAIQIWGRSLRTHGDIPKVKIVDLCSVYLKCGLPDDERNWNKSKDEDDEKFADDGSKVEDEEDDITDIAIECRECKYVFRMIDAKRNTVTTSEYLETEYFCPSCNSIAKVITKELQSVEVAKLLTASDIDQSMKYSLVEIKQLLGEMIKMNTRAKTSWGHFIHRECVVKNRKAYENAYKGYDQKVYSSNQAWKRIMDIYNG